MINSNCGTIRVGLFAIDVAIDYNNNEAQDLIHFLFQDLPGGALPLSARRFEVLIVGRPAKMSLWQGEKQLYFGESCQAMAHILVNEIIYDCITHNSNDHAIHAAAFGFGKRGFILPGKSGSGKSSLAAWLTAQGCTYLTDELVLLAKEGRITPFTRPISLKSPSFEILSRDIPLAKDTLLIGQEGAMIPHRILNPHWIPASFTLDTIIFPKYIKDHSATLTELSSIRSCMKLLECYVNARNIPNHGFGEIAELTRQAACYELKFGSFDDLPRALQPVLSTGL
jgi:hypothetical protein